MPQQMTRTSAKRLAAGLLAAVAVFWLAGCAELMRRPEPPPPPVEDPVETTRRAQDTEYDIAVRSFRAGDIDVAHKLFKNLIDKGVNSDLVRRARYGLACTSLAMASSAEEMDLALALYAEWNEQAPEHFAQEDPRLLAPAVMKVRDILAQQKNIIETRRKQTDAERRVGSLKKQVDERDGQLAERDAQLAEKDATIARLTQQIEELDAVHRSMQMKKKELGN